MRGGKAAGWIGMVLIHGSTMPTIFLRLAGDTVAPLPPLSMVLMLFFGLSLFLYYAIARRDLIYFVSNLIGALGQAVLLWMHLAG